MAKDLAENVGPFCQYHTIRRFILLPDSIPCNEAGFGLMDYKARYYSPGLGRFISADMVVPEPGNPQSWNRYSYTRNNPLKYIDPTGHAECYDEECKHRINPVTEEFIGNKEVVKSNYWPLPGSTEFVTERPDEPLMPIAAEKLDALSDIGNLSSLLISGGGMVVEGIAIAAGIAFPSLGEEPGVLALGVIAYQPADRIGDFIGGVSAGATVLSDFLGGDLYFSNDDDGIGVVIPSSSQVEVLGAAAGMLVPEATIDASIDTVVLSRRLQEISIGSITINPQLESRFPTRKITLIPKLGD